MKNKFLENQIRRFELAKLRFGGRPLKTRVVTGPQSTETASQVQKSEAAKRVILLVTDDAKLENGFRSAATAQGHILIRAESLTDALRTTRTGCSQFALLDLDMAAESAWDTADCLLQTHMCPPVILMTGRDQQFDLRMAVNTGVILNKTTEPSRILDLVHKILAAPAAALAERNRVQRILVQWLRPLHWPMPSISSCRHWGINE